LNRATGINHVTLIEYLSLERIVKRLSGLTVPADALTWHRFFGALLLSLLVLLFLSGAFMAFYYSPALGSAYDSVDYALFSLPFGGIIKGVHHYGWNLFLVVLGAHLVRAFVVSAYKPPRQMIWVSGVMILFFVPLFIITGDLLPWDQKGFWSTQVRLSIIGSIPFIGDLLVRLFQGGPLTGIVALTRFYVLHILFLPGLLAFLILIHFHFIKNNGLSYSFSNDNFSTKTVRFFPVIFNRWLILFMGVTLVLGLVSWYWPAPLGDPADPTDSSYVPRPEWWVLFLNQLVTIFKGSFSVVGSVIIPGGLAGLLIVLPFIDSSPERHPVRRKRVMLCAAIIAIAILALSIMGYLEHFSTPHV